jgi:hypothetical protein
MTIALERSISNMLENGQEVFYLTSNHSFSKGKIIQTKDHGYHWDIDDPKFGIIEKLQYLHIFENEKELAIFLEIQCH